MVNEKNELKIIDLGFGKMVESSDDFDKSISLNYWCELPLEFHSDVYDFCTEVYFVGKLFEKLIQVNDIEDFKYRTVLDQMCRRDSHERTGTFADISTRVKNEQFYEIEFDLNERRSYQEFSGAIRQHIAKIEKSAKYVVDVRLFQADLEDVYRNVMLASEIPDPNVVIRCIINGSYTYYRKRFSVNTLRDFVHLLKSSSEEKSRIILANLHTLLNSIERFTEKMLDDDEIPF